MSGPRGRVKRLIGDVEEGWVTGDFCFHGEGGGWGEEGLVDGMEDINGMASFSRVVRKVVMASGWDVGGRSEVDRPDRRRRVGGLVLAAIYGFNSLRVSEVELGGGGYGGDAWLGVVYMGGVWYRTDSR